MSWHIGLDVLSTMFVLVAAEKKHVVDFMYLEPMYL